MHAARSPARMYSGIYMYVVVLCLLRKPSRTALALLESLVHVDSSAKARNTLFCIEITFSLTFIACSVLGWTFLSPVFSSLTLGTEEPSNSSKTASYSSLSLPVLYICG